MDTSPGSGNFLTETYISIRRLENEVIRTLQSGQMMKETENIMLINLDFLPLKPNANIVEASTLRIDWNDVIPAEELNYIMGNLPFIGNSRLSEQQKKDRDKLFVDRSVESDCVAELMKMYQKLVEK